MLYFILNRRNRRTGRVAARLHIRMIGRASNLAASNAHASPGATQSNKTERPATQKGNLS